MNLPRNYSLRPEINIDDLAIVSVPLPYLMSHLEVVGSEQYDTAIKLMQDKMEQKGWVDEREKVLKPFHITVFADYSKQDLQFYLFMVGIANYGHNPFYSIKELHNLN